MADNTSHDHLLHHPRPGRRRARRAPPRASGDIADRDRRAGGPAPSLERMTAAGRPHPGLGRARHRLHPLGLDLPRDPVRDPDLPAVPHARRPGSASRACCSTPGRSDAATAPATAPGWRQWRAAAIVGGALLLVGNGSVTWSEQRVSTGVASLVVATVPLWMALFDRVATGQRLSAHGRRSGSPSASAAPRSSRTRSAPATSTSLGAASSARLDLVGRRLALRAPRAAAAAAARRRLDGDDRRGRRLHVARRSPPASPAAAHHVSRPVARSRSRYLIVLGSLVGFTAYVWLLRNAPTLARLDVRVREPRGRRLPRLGDRERADRRRA